jgi:thioredoxin 1
MSIQHIAKYQFESNVLNSEDFVIVDFWAPWCKPCVTMGKTLSEINITYKGTLKIYKINVDDEPELARAFGVQSIPTIIMFYKGKPFGRVVGSTTIQNLIGEIEKAKKSAGL